MILAVWLYFVPIDDVLDKILLLLQFLQFLLLLVDDGHAFLQLLLQPLLLTKLVGIDHSLILPSPSVITYYFLPLFPE